MEIRDVYEQWCTKLYFDNDTRNELLSIKDNEDEIKDRFYTDLEFGTAGLRGIIGAGTNRMNIYVVRRVSIAIARCLSQGKQPLNKKSIIISYDSRHYSKDFAMEAASVFAGYGFRVFIFPEICSVPILSYAIRKIRCVAGIMITASHNPKEYNGYKVYGRDGAQLSPEVCSNITEQIQLIDDYTKMPKFSYDYLLSIGNIKYAEKKTIENYYKELLALLIDPDGFKENADNIKVVYTPLHGSGGRYVPEVLKLAGFNNIVTVSEQMKPDGDFPTVNVPNPEDPNAFVLALNKAKETNADIVLATDPDADRTGVYVKNRNNEYILLSGNQIGLLLLHRIITGRKESGNLKENSFVVSTIVSTRLTKHICQENGIKYYDVLTGFKYIGEQIKLHQENGNESFIFGFEESFGYLAGSYARDKDAIASCLLLTEAAVHYMTLGKTLIDVINDIYEEYGYYSETQVSLTLKGQQGIEIIKKVMGILREKRFAAFSDLKLHSVKDYLILKEYNVDGSESKIMDIPSSDVISFNSENSWLTIRPSGTEPKIKIYFGSKGQSFAQSKKELMDIKDRSMKSIMLLLK